MNLTLTAVSVAGCKGAAITIFLTAVSSVPVAGCKGAATAIFLTAVSMAGCKGVASKVFCTFLVNFWSILGFRGSLEWPWGPLVITCAPGPLKKSILAAFGDPAGVPWGTRLGPFSGSGLPRDPHGEPLEAIC